MLLDWLVVPAAIVADCWCWLRLSDWLSSVVSDWRELLEQEHLSAEADGEVCWGMCYGCFSSSVLLSSLELSDTTLFEP